MSRPKDPKTETIPGFRAARLWLDLSQFDASKDAGVCDRTYKMWELHGPTEFALSPAPGQDQAPLAILADAWGIPEEILRSDAPAVDYRRLRLFCESNGGLETVFKALEFARRMESEDGEGPG